MQEAPPKSLIEHAREIYDLLQQAEWGRPEGQIITKSISLPEELTLASPQYTFFVQYALQMIASYRDYCMIASYSLNHEDGTAELKCHKDCGARYDADIPIDDDSNGLDTEQSFRALKDNFERGHAEDMYPNKPSQRWHMVDGKLAICPIESHSTYNQSLFYISAYFAKFGELAKAITGRELLTLHTERKPHSLTKQEVDELVRVTMKVKDVHVFAKILGVEPERIIANAKANIVAAAREK